VGEMLFPDEAFALLQQARWDASATRQYEIMSGGFAWSDEWPSDVAYLCVERGSWAFRYVMGYRASLIRGAPREELRAPWDQLLRECPEWPGFRPERSSPALTKDLDYESNRAFRELDELDRCMIRFDHSSLARTLNANGFKAEVRGDGAARFVFAQAEGRAVEISELESGVWVEYWDVVETPKFERTFRNTVEALADVIAWLSGKPK